MKRKAITQPDTDPGLQRSILESQARKGHGWRDRGSRERVVELLAAGSFLVVAILVALGFDDGRSFDPALAAGLLALFVLAARVEFYMGNAFTVPTQLVLVPMLFLLPTSVVPLIVAAGLVLSRLPGYLRREVRVEGAVIAVGDAWHALGPAIVLSAAGATTPDWGDWSIYLAALCAQFAVDFATSALRIRFGQGIAVRRMAREFAAIYIVDALLSPVGLLVAFASVNEEWSFLAVAPLIGLIWVFSQEREARIENALTLSSAYRGTAHLLGELLSTTHEYTGHHSRSVVVLAHQVGDALGLDEATLRDVEFGALLHDVGKMAVPNEIINKPGKLTDDKWELMKTHTIEGYEMLDRIGGALAEVGAVVRSHHERYDGRGYPDGLAGEEIPIASRVITACDSFNAMTSNRSYSRARSIPEAIAEMRRESGKQFDPRVVEALIEIVETWEQPSRTEPTRFKTADVGSPLPVELEAAASEREPLLG
jgi:putative nucleotidyltransferase with HDIG domain